MFCRLIQMRVVPTSVVNTFRPKDAHLQNRKDQRQQARLHWHFFHYEQNCSFRWSLLPLPQTPTQLQYLRDTYKMYIRLSRFLNAPLACIPPHPTRDVFHKDQIECD